MNRQRKKNLKQEKKNKIINEVDDEFPININKEILPSTNLTTKPELKSKNNELVLQKDIFNKNNSNVLLSNISFYNTYNIENNFTNLDYLNIVEENKKIKEENKKLHQDLKDYEEIDNETMEELYSWLGKYYNLSQQIKLSGLGEYYNIQDDIDYFGRFVDEKYLKIEYPMFNLPFNDICLNNIIYNLQLKNTLILLSSILKNIVISTLTVKYKNSKENENIDNNFNLPINDLPLNSKIKNNKEYKTMLNDEINNEVNIDIETLNTKSLNTLKKYQSNNIIKKIKEMLKNNTSIRSMVEILNEYIVKCNINIKPFTKSTLHNIINNYKLRKYILKKKTLVLHKINYYL